MTRFAYGLPSAQGRAGFCTRIRFQVQVHPWCDSIYRIHGGRAAPGAGWELLCFLRGPSVPEWTVYGDPCFFTYPHWVPGPRQRQPRTLVKTILTRQSYALPGDTLQGWPVRVLPRDVLLGTEDTLSE